MKIKAPIPNGIGAFCLGLKAILFTQLTIKQYSPRNVFMSVYKPLSLAWGCFAPIPSCIIYLNTHFTC